MGEVLLYNIPEGEKRRRILVATTRLGIRARDVSAEEYAHPIGWLAGLEGFAPGGEPAGESFADEMLVMCGLPAGKFNAFLDALRASRANVALKAVLTDTNAGWNSLELHRAIRAEHEAMRARAPGSGQGAAKP